MQNKIRPLSFWEAVIVLILVLGIMGVGVIGLGISPQVPVMLALGFVIVWARWRHVDWATVNVGVVEGIEKGIIPIFIFILIGAMISTWIAAGTIPTLMVIGFKLISVKWFLPSVFIACALVGMAVGSTFTVVSTVGLACFGMGITMGLNPALVAGTIISGSVFGDKLSPLSETNNLTSAVMGLNLFTHMRNLFWSIFPAGAISLILVTILGHTTATVSWTRIQQTVTVLQQSFKLSFWALVPIILIFACVILKMPAIPTMLLNIFVSAVLLLIEHPNLALKRLAHIITDGYVAHTSSASVNQLLSRGGIISMMPTVALIVLTLSLGGLLVKFGLIEAVMTPIAEKLTSDGKLVFAALAASIGVNLFVGEQFLSIILPGRAFKTAFQQGGLTNGALGRVLEDGGTVVNYLVPWSVGGVFLANTLGVATIDYLPFTFFSLLCPVMSLISGFAGIGLQHLKPQLKSL